MAVSLPVEANPPRVLVVDDDQEVAKSIEATLRRHYQVFVVHSGVGAIKEARRHSPDIIVLDVIMPGMDGLEACRQLRNDPALTDIPILFLTALGRPEDKVAGFRAGADDYGRGRVPGGIPRQRGLRGRGPNHAQTGILRRDRQHVPRKDPALNARTCDDGNGWYRLPAS